MNRSKPTRGKNCPRRPPPVTEDELELKFHRLAAAAWDAILLLDESGKICFLNAAAEKLFGYSKAQAADLPIHRLLAIDPIAGSPDGPALALREEQHPTGEIGEVLELSAIRQDGGRTPVEISLSTIQVDGRWQGIIIARDITDRKNAEAQERRLLEELEQKVQDRTRDLERVIAELREAMQKIKTLSGLIPICAGCKKIRDDKGYWNQIEIYLMRHSDAMFTHGLCPECVKRFYPGASGGG
jgi:PAS domain S-box-containing protein